MQKEDPMTIHPSNHYANEPSDPCTKFPNTVIGGGKPFLQTLPYPLL